MFRYRGYHLLNIKALRDILDVNDEETYWPQYRMLLEAACDVVCFGTFDEQVVVAKPCGSRSFFVKC